MENNNAFTYTYSAKEQEEVAKIRNKYMPREESKLERLRRLDKSAAQKGAAAAIALGVVGTLVLGLGMSCTMVWGESLFIPGIIVGAVGIGLVSAAYPLYNGITRKERARLAPEIISLSDELLK